MLIMRNKAIAGSIIGGLPATQVKIDYIAMMVMVVLLGGLV